MFKILQLKSKSCFTSIWNKTSWQMLFLISKSKKVKYLLLNQLILKLNNSFVYYLYKLCHKQKKSLYLNKNRQLS